MRAGAPQRWQEALGGGPGRPSRVGRATATSGQVDGTLVGGGERGQAWLRVLALGAGAGLGAAALVGCSGPSTGPSSTGQSSIGQSSTGQTSIGQSSIGQSSIDPPSGSSGAPSKWATTSTSTATRAAQAPIAGPVLEVGDSLGIDLGWGLAEALAGSGHRFVGQSVGDTGLAEPWYFNWPAHLAVELTEYHPGLVIVFLGANDVESLYVGGRFDPFGSRAWAAAYGARVAEMMDEASAARARLLWVGMPPMGTAAFSSQMATLNWVYQSEAAKHGPDVAYFASWTVLGTVQGQYQQGPVGAPAQPWREPDGIHITVQGAGVLADAVVRELSQKGWLPKPSKTRPSAGGHNGPQADGPSRLQSPERGG